MLHTRRHLKQLSRYGQHVSDQWASYNSHSKTSRNSATTEDQIKRTHLAGLGDEVDEPHRAIQTSCASLAMYFLTMAGRSCTLSILLLETRGSLVGTSARAVVEMKEVLHVSVLCVRPSAYPISAIYSTCVIIASYVTYNVCAYARI